MLAVKVEDLAAGRLQRDRIERPAVGGVPPPIQLEGARTEVDEDGAGGRTAGVPMPSGSGVPVG